MQLQYQIAFQSWGTAVGCLLTAVLGTWLELRRRRHVLSANSQEEEP